MAGSASSDCHLRWDSTCIRADHPISPPLCLKHCFRPGNIGKSGRSHFARHVEWHSPTVMLAKSRLLLLRSLLPNGQKPKLLREHSGTGTLAQPSREWFHILTPALNPLPTTQKTKAPQTLSSQGTPLSNNPPPKTAHNHSTFCSALAPS
jgi:hypothetical protein